MTNPLLHKAKLLLLTLPFLLLPAAACTTPHATLTTEKKIGETMSIYVEGKKDNLWIDLNGNGSCDEDEKLTHNDFGKRQEFTIQSQTITIYGDLTKLYCSSKQLTRLDISKLTKLETLSCGENQLKSIDVSKLTKLTGLDCSSNQLTSLNVRNLPKLKVLACYNNRIKLGEMAKIINDLPVVDNDGSHTFAPNNFDDSNEQNEITREQLEKITMSKGWRPVDPDYIE